jgi:GTPase
MTEVFGKVQGLKASQARRLERLSSRSASSQLVCDPFLARALTEAAADVGRYVAVMANRRGGIEHVVLGESTRLYLPDVGRVRGAAGRLRGLRLLLAKPQGDPHKPLVVDGDLVTDLERLQLDALCVMEALPDGLPGRVSLCTMHPPPPTTTTTTTMQLGAGFRERFLSGEGLVVAGDDTNKARSTRHTRLDAPSIHELNVDFPELIADLETAMAKGADDARDAAPTAATRDSAVLVGVYGKHEGLGRGHAQASMNELVQLARTAGVRVVDQVMQVRDAIDGRTVVGSGKLEEICLRALHAGAEAVIFDRDLSPSQLNAITDITDMKVLDRTMLILDIFARRATSKEGRMQVELAQLKYSIPRLAKKQSGLSRLTGGIGGQGPGETKLEIDRRRAREKITRLERDIERFSQERALRRKHRQDQSVPVIALVGYTNAGKSTLLNCLTGADAYVANELFATLDTTTRRLRLGTMDVVVTDTVGFIRDLPETLINAFRATLEELHEADVLLHVVDAQDDRQVEHMRAVEQVLEQLGVTTTPRMVVFNKCEGGYTGKEPRGWRVSARTGEGKEALLIAVQQVLQPAQPSATGRAG